ncbi:TIR domain-containing protein [Flavilitoribacter nigricans]|uniref:TIR domain-containing protein n=1 Tax=Flavilitoribacter nigricans TaxID=70997 RepID=UPI001C9E1F76|nr:TIR domain-containing protein [Flavilitoribacter nigricans]
MATLRHKVFVSYHHANDQVNCDQFETLFADTHQITVTKCVRISEIDPYQNAERLGQIIRDQYLRDIMVTVVLILQRPGSGNMLTGKLGPVSETRRTTPGQVCRGFFCPVMATTAK